MYIEFCDGKIYVFLVISLSRKFLLCCQSQVPAKPNYSLVLYYASERPINKDSLLAKFLDGNDMFRDARFKLIPSIVEVCDSQ